MNQIALLSNETIDKIAAGEVVERPLNVVKELVENSIDAGATAITVEIKGGGSELIRVTDNGCGIDSKECEKAFLRHATSKLRTIEDLDTLVSLGFRGEALSSVSAVSKVEMITKTEASMLGTRVVVEGGRLMEKSEIGAPNGTTIIVRKLFYNTPARRKFLKTPTTETANVEDILEKVSLSNPEVSIQFISNSKTHISTAGNCNLKDAIFSIFGKDVYSSLIPVDYLEEGIHITGFTAKPEFSYQARNGELYFVNKRYCKSKVINTAIEEAYRNYLMQHRFPFCVLNINLSQDTIDINVHPQKLEVKFSDSLAVSNAVLHAIASAIKAVEMIPEVSVPDALREPANKLYEPFQESLTESAKEAVAEEMTEYVSSVSKPSSCNSPLFEQAKPFRPAEPFEAVRREVEYKEPEYVQETLFEKKLISDAPLKEYRIIGQVFDTYWLITLDEDLYIVDQHAAHEKVNYENLLKRLDGSTEILSQQIIPPTVLHLSALESDTIKKYMDTFFGLGFEIEEFGINSFLVRAIPLNLFGINDEEMFRILLDELIEKEGAFRPSFIAEKLASMSCKAAIKGGQKITFDEMGNLMKQIMALDNPYNCPHGRPVFIKITKTELEKKFKRIV